MTLNKLKTMKQIVNENMKNKNEKWFHEMKRKSYSAMMNTN